ncbi:CRISPR-associated protein Cas4 [Methanosphaera sp. WGK6]|uniref:CRISPR-associated protein Cas4 n=1 Tax=Methanosphaera sp. WGK6 TaxID=1561964 RepID=UPI00084C03AB|nr:CRISPR-associated protein Cas4 [Methanosphaera sp. WGK6]OED29513.1 CRISPR-associated protein Cas4 [Methanosphaera sp. WGK6]
MMKTSEITGVMIQYYMTCPRELWLYLNQINMNYDNDDIDIGKLIHETSYKREKKEIRIDNVVFDFIQTNDKLTVFEVKKSSKLTIGAKYQLYYYLYILKKAGIDAEGMLVFPKERKRIPIILTDEIIDKIEKILQNIKQIATQEKPPQEEQKPYCKRCSYNELCMI